MSMSRVRLASIVTAALFAAAACAPRKMVQKGPSAGEQSARSGSSDDLSPLSPGVESEELKIGGKQFKDVADLKPVRFDYDMYTLATEARLVLRENAAYLKGHPDMEVLIEGHCDERGTLEYNLALGQKRAKEVRDYYIRLGIAGRKIGTISFGEERSACTDSTEECWSRYRRAETKVRAQTVSNGIHRDHQ